MVRSIRAAFAVSMRSVMQAGTKLLLDSSYGVIVMYISMAVASGADRLIYTHSQEAAMNPIKFNLSGLMLIAALLALPTLGSAQSAQNRSMNSSLSRDRGKAR